MTHICVSKLTTIGSDNGLSPGRRQAIIWTNVELLLIGPLGTNFSEMWIEIHTFSFKKIHLKMSSGKWRPFCLGLNVLMGSGQNWLGPNHNKTTVSIILEMSCDYQSELRKINTLRLSDRYFSVPSHLKQCSNIPDSTLGNKFKWHFEANTTTFIQENVVCKIMVILSRSQCVKTKKS